MTAKWYAVRAKPGSQKTAARIEGLPAHRIGESIIERDCRNEGIEVYMPSFWTTVQHKRTNKLIDRRFPLLVGYAFVCVHDQFELVRSIDSVMYFIRNGSGGPAAFRDTDIGAMMLHDHEARATFEAERQTRERQARAIMRAGLVKSLGQIFPKGRRRKLSLTDLANREIDSLPAHLHERVLWIMKELRRLDQEDGDCIIRPMTLYSAA